MKQTHIINFDKTHKEPRGEKISGEDLKGCQTVQHDRVKQYPKKEQDNFLIGAFRTKRSYLYFEKELLNDHFRCQKSFYPNLMFVIILSMKLGVSFPNNLVNLA